ncbi:unnamed protein product [Polarella glacialis]|uniref:Pentatricopeptide repeat-containing protein, chloroplastic n=1 Tax=Polarella glacialis TaxID=89957 RepID=A0A813HT34_POLGL|nr:unnamed protein product [Polarella glacialis]
MPAVVAPPSDAKGYTLAIGAAASRSSWQQSLALVHAMPQRRVAVNIITLNAAASTFSRRQCPLSYGWVKAADLFASMRRAGPQPDVVSFNVLASCCEKGRQWRRAVTVLDILRWQGHLRADAITFNTVIASCEKAGCWESALEILRCMDRDSRKGQQGNQVSFLDLHGLNSAISACEKGLQWQRALFLLLEDCAGRRLHADAITYSAAITACGHGARSDIALDLLRSMRHAKVEPKVFCFNAAITTCGARSLQWEPALELLWAARQLSVEPNTVTGNAALGACGPGHRWEVAVAGLQFLLSGSGLRANILSFNSAISAVNFGREAWQVAVSFLEAAQHYGLLPDIITLGAVGDAFDKALQWQHAINLLREAVPYYSVLPDKGCFGAAISACERCGQWEMALELLQVMSAGRRPESSVDVAAFGAAVNACGKTLRWAQALQLQRELLRRGLQASTQGHNAVMDACARARRWQRALDLLADMRPLGNALVPDAISFSIAVAAFGGPSHLTMKPSVPASSPWFWALQLADDLRCQGARPAVVGVEGALVGACAAGAQWQPALRLIGDLLNSQQEPDAASVGAATSACRRARQWESAISLLVQAASGSQSLATDIAAQADACEAAPVGEAPLARLLEDLDRQSLQVGLGACSRRRGRVVQAIAVEVLEPAADLPVPSKDWASLLSQAEFVASASFPPEVPPKPSAPVPVAKVLVEFPADPDGFFWHHRILLKRIAGPTWLALTPDHDICRHNLETSRHLVLERAAQFPAAQRAFVYAFDPIDRATLEGFKRIAATQAALLGDGGDVEAKGIVKIGNEEVFVEKVQADQLAAWAAKTVKDAGDIRLLGDHRDAAGKRKLDLSSAVAMMRESKIDDFPLQGVRACREYLSAISEGPGNIVSYHSEWVRLSGVNEASAVCHTHRTLAETLRLLVSFDQVDLSNMAGGEQLVRWIIQIETAVERNPKLPDFSGLDIVTGATTTAEGKALAPKFGEWITERMKSRATIWKSQRQYNEERRGSAKVKGDGKGGKGAQAAADKDRDGKKKKKDAGGAQAAADDQRATMEATGKRNKFSSPAFGVRARDRRHGDPFPLPVPSSHSALFRAANTGQRQVFEALHSLNALAGPTLKSASAQQHSLPPSACLKPTSVQQWMMDDVVERISRHGEQPADLSEESSLGELLASSGPYSGDVGHLASFDISKIKVLSRPLRPQEAASLCPPRTAGYYKHFRHVIERDERELEVLRESNYDGLTPYWDPKLKRSRGTRIGLYQALHRVGLLTFRRRAKAKVGFFVVAKKDGMQRLIVDARVPNMCHRRPPPTRLGTSGAYLDLDLGDHAASGFGPVYEPSGNEGDVGDCFYNFLQEDLASWFCADDWMTSEEWMSLGIDVGEVFDDELRCKLCPSRDERLCPAFLGVCMGWSWALHNAQEIVSHQVSQTENFDKSDQIRDKQVAPLLQPGRPVLGIYVDNVAIIGGVPEDADRRMRAVCERFGQLGIPFVVTHKSSQSYLDTIGLRFDFARRALMHKSRRCWRLRLATLALLRRRKVRGSVLQVWGGHVIHHCSLLRPGMSCLHSFYRFIEFAGNEQKVLWPSVRQEMRLVIGLVFLGEAHLGAPIHENVYLGDSSTYGFSLMVTKSSQLEVRQATLHRERWRFIVPDVELGAPLVSPLDFSSLGGLSPLGGDVAPPPGLWPPGAHEISSGWSRGSCPGAGFGTSTQYGRQLLQQAELRRKPVQSWRPSRPPRPLVEVPDSIPVIGPEWDKRDRYTLLVAAPWHHTAEHINIKEMRVLLMGVRRCCRDRSALGHRVLLLSDNLVSVLALEKGRSSSYSLNLLCRRAAAYSIGGRISFRFRHIGTDRNVADAPSRCIPDNAQTHLAQLGLHRWVLGVGLEARIRGRLRWANLQGLQLGGQLHASRRRTSQQPKYFLELFSGSGVLTTAFKQAGCNVLPACEILNGVQFDLTRHSTQEALLRLLRTGRIWYVHMGTPCTVWSRARHGLTNMARARAKETVGVELALFSVAVARLASSLNIWWSIENPRSSRLWNFHPVSELLQLPHTHWFHWDMCMYDSPNKKPTATMTNCPSLAGLARACQGGHKHMVLRGTERVRLLDGLTVTRNKTAGAGVYPVPLCRRWCSLATSLCPAGAFGDSSSGFKGESESALSHAARAASSSVHGLAMPHEQTQKRADHDFLGNPCYRAQRYREPIIFGQHSNAEAEVLRQQRPVRPCQL